jgi:hypothetical protein
LKDRSAKRSILRPVADSDCGKTWWPNYVSGGSGASEYSGYRYGNTRFKWTGATSSRLKALKCYDDVTLEPDFVTYNYDNKHYYSNSIASWSTTMPCGYKDTKFADGEDEPTYTVGCYDATKLKSDYEYLTYFRTANGNYNSDTGKVFIQRGNRTPSTCTSTWCIFAKETNQYIKAWTLPVPGSKKVTK